MSVRVEQINPLDLRESVGVGIALPFSGKAVFNTTFTTKDAIKSNLINYFLTNKGERYLNPTFGSDIRSLLFNNIDLITLNTIKERVQKEVRNFFPRVQINEFNISSTPDNNTVEVFLKYSIVNSNIDDQILINIVQ